MPLDWKGLLHSKPPRCNLIICSSPGSGKTTHVPHLVAESEEGKVLVIQPRRMAARMSAVRASEVASTELGKEIGYQVRFDDCTTEKTKVIYQTDGLFLRQLSKNPELKGISCLIFDEFHERRASNDLAFSYVRWLQKNKRLDLRILVMSATLEAQGLKDFLEGELLEAKAPQFPVEIEYHPPKDPSRWEGHVANLVRHALKGEGDVLVFLPGKREILKLKEALGEISTALVLALHGDLSLDEQVRTVQPVQGKRRIILSTNIAETSLTIEGIQKVIDVGLHRQSVYDPWSGLSRLKEFPISQASAIQRAGRAGRLSAGTCYRAYSKYEFQSRLPFDRPEITRTDLSQLALLLGELKWNLDTSFPWYENPPTELWKRALETLEFLRCIENGALTLEGLKIAESALPPRLGKVALSAANIGLHEEVFPLAVALNEGELRGQHELVEFRHLSQQGRRIFKTLINNFNCISKSTDFDEKDLWRCWFEGYFDRVAKVRSKSVEKVDFTLCSAGSLTLSRHEYESWGSHEYYSVISAFSSSSKNAKSASRPEVLFPIVEEWLLNHPMASVESNLTWNSEKKRIEWKESLKYGALSLVEEVSSPPEKENLVDFWINSVLKLTNSEMEDFACVLERLSHFHSTESLSSFLARIQIATRQDPIMELEIEPSRPSTWLPLLLKGVHQLTDPSILISYNAEKILNQKTPTHIQLGKRRVQIRYEINKAPWIESRIQDFFGLKKTPTIMEGALPLTCHLLAPNQRAVQVTQDLEGFWKTHYPKIRQELSRRYPRHAWPLDVEKGEKKYRQED